MKKIILACLILLTACNRPQQKGLVYFNDFETMKGWAPVWLSKKIVHSGTFSNQVDSTHLYGESFRQLFREISDNKVVKVKASFWIYVTPQAQGKLVVEVKRPDDSFAFWTCKEFVEIAPKLGQWQQAKAEFTFPDSVIRSANTIAIYPWNTSKGTFYVDDIRLEFVLGY